MGKIFDEKDPTSVQNLALLVIIPTLCMWVLMVANNFQQSLYFNIIGIIYEIIGFVLMLGSTKNKIKIPKSDFQKGETIEIDFISKQKLWRLGLVLIILGLIFQLTAIMLPQNPTFD